MLHIGQILRQARIKRGMSQLDVEQKTKIKREFIAAIERGNWRQLPEYAVVVGFVKNLSSLFGLDPEKGAAFLRRDYPRVEEFMSPKPDIEDAKRFSWSPKFTFAVSVTVVIIVITAYVVYQYTDFTRAPRLEVTLPTDGQNISDNQVQVLGITDENSTLMVNSQPVVVGRDGSFSATVTVENAEKEIVVKSISRSGKETVVTRSISTN